MGRTPLQKDKLELITTDFHHRLLVGEKMTRCLVENELLLQETPLRQRGQPLPLCNLAAWIRLLEVRIEGKDSVAIRGRVEGKADFYSETGLKEVSFAEKDFFQEVALPGAEPGMEVNAHGRIVYLGEEGPPLEAEGQLLYKISVETEVCLSVVDNRQLTLALGAKKFLPEQLERKVVVFEELFLEKAIPLTLSDELEFSGTLEYFKILSSYLADLEWKEEKEKILLQGNLVSVYFYKSEDGSGFGENSQFFKQEIALPGLQKGDHVSLFPVVEYAACDLKGEKARQRAYVDLFLRVTRQLQQEVLLEIRGTGTYKEPLLLPRAAGMAGEELELVQRLPLPYPQELAAGAPRLRSVQVRVEDDGVAVSGMLKRKIYYLPEQKREEDIFWQDEGPGEPDSPAAGKGDGGRWPLSMEVEEPFQSYLHLPGVPEDAEVLLCVKGGKSTYAPAEAATLQISRLALKVKARRVEEVAVVVPPRVPPGTSMVVYVVKKGDNLLRIARYYGLRSADLAESNGLVEDEPLMAGQKLLIPLMYYRR